MDKEKAIEIEFANCLKNNYTVNFDEKKSGLKTQKVTIRIQI